MLVQTLSKIFKSDFRTWLKEENYARAIIFQNEEKTGSLKSVSEIVCDESADYKISFAEDRTLILFPLYGEVIITDYYEKVVAGESLIIQLEKNKELNIKNHLNNDKADVLIFEFLTLETDGKYIKTSLDFSNQNNFLPMAKGIDIPNFVGIYDGRSEGFYPLKNKENAIFGMVIQGAFEFQNRLMETRDAILLWENQELEFEALSQSALILFMEI